MYNIFAQIIVMDVLGAFTVIGLMLGLVAGVMWLLGSTIAWGFFKYGLIVDAALVVLAGISKALENLRTDRRWQRTMGLCQMVATNLHRGAQVVISHEPLADGESSDLKELRNLLIKHENRKNVYCLRRLEDSWELAFKPPTSDDFIPLVHSALNEGSGRACNCAEETES